VERAREASRPRADNQHIRLKFFPLDCHGEILADAKFMIANSGLAGFETKTLKKAAENSPEKLRLEPGPIVCFQWFGAISDSGSCD
jgi:hypothetical protein